MNPYDLKIVTLNEIQCAMIKSFKTCLCDCVKTIEAYSGQFNEDEVQHVSFEAPALFLTITRGSEADQRNQMDVRFAAIVITKSADREDRSSEGLTLVQRTLECIKTIHKSFDCANVELATDKSFENLYSRRFDKLGFQVWGINWNHVVTL